MAGWDMVESESSVLRGEQGQVRTFSDSEGMEWEVVVGRESWGTVVAIFVRKGSPDPPRETLLEVSSWDEGNQQLLEMPVERLRALLDASTPKSME